MSTKENKPKRKRRTKEEIDAAVAAGTYKRRPSQAKKKAVEVKELPDEEKVLIMSCLNKGLIKSTQEIAKAQGVEVVMLEDKVLHDYLATKAKKKEGSDLQSFLDDTTNRLHAENQCLKLWTILTQGEPVEGAKTRVFTSKEVVDKTNLTHKKAQSLFGLLRAFGLLEFIKGSHQFVLNFDAKRRHRTIEIEALAMAELLNSDILRYKVSIESDEGMSDKEKEELWNKFMKSVNLVLKHE